MPGTGGCCTAAHHGQEERTRATLALGDKPKLNATTAMARAARQHLSTSEPQYPITPEPHYLITSEPTKVSSGGAPQVTGAAVRPHARWARWR
jgi:hypothetical protein